MNRRQFIHRGALSALIPLTINKSFSAPMFSLFEDDPDAALCKVKFDFAVSQKLTEKPINEVIVEIGKTFIGTDYAGHVIEQPGDEHLIVNMRALDCVSFYENSLVLARCIKMKKFTFDDYKAQLQFIRYRGGSINGYPSRLHYTTDYWYDNERKGVLRIVTKELIGEKNLQPIPKPINFMSTHRSAYRQLENEKFYQEIIEQENEINTREMLFLPKGNMHMYADQIPTGSLIGITTNMPGMDISHTGIAIRLENGKLHFMHAPNVGYKVQISDVPMHDYLARNAKQTGIIIAQALEPK
jgi:hypothetical protein